MTRITLINPQMPFNTPAKTDPWIKHGLASLSARLKQEGHEVSLIDFRFLPCDLRDQCPPSWQHPEQATHSEAYRKDLEKIWRGVF